MEKDKKCLICGNKFSVKPSRQKRAKFCSLKCRYIGQSEKLKDVTGQKFGRLKAIKYVGAVKQKSGKRHAIWLWSCECGVTKEILLNSVNSGNTKSCGCLFASMQRNKDITGQRFGCLTAIKITAKIGEKRRRKCFWELLCDCGKTTKVSTGNLTSGKVKTCGCRMNSKGENSHNWSGGRKVDSAGYVYLYAPDHPNSPPRRGYIAEHRLVMEKTLGRYLTRKEEVHHLNGIKDDNRPENLELWSGSHPRGTRVKDLVNFAREILSQYGDLFPAN